MFQTQHTTRSQSEARPPEQPLLSLLKETDWHHIKQRYHLSPRELQVARLVCSGLNNEQIAHHLRIRDGTVKTHLRNIYRRIRVRNKIALLLKFVEDVSAIPTAAQLPSVISIAAQTVQPASDDAREGAV